MGTWFQMRDRKAEFSGECGSRALIPKVPGVEVTCLCALLRRERVLASWGEPGETWGGGGLARSSRPIADGLSLGHSCVWGLQQAVSPAEGLGCSPGWEGAGQQESDPGKRILYREGAACRPQTAEALMALKGQKYLTGRGRGNRRDWCRCGCHGVCLSAGTDPALFNPLGFTLWHGFSRTSLLFGDRHGNRMEKGG